MRSGAAEVQGDVSAVLNRDSEDHKRVIRELGMFKIKLLRDGLLG